MTGMTAIWAPPMERSKMSSYYITGCSFGTMVLFPIGGLLIGTFEWPSLFYFCGTLGKQLVFMAAIMCSLNFVYHGFPINIMEHFFKIAENEICPAWVSTLLACALKMFF
jgi:predicted MFS family arabinose efflux permease